MLENTGCAIMGNPEKMAIYITEDQAKQNVSTTQYMCKKSQIT